MYLLELIDKQSRTMQFQLNQEGTMSVGRLSGNDIIIDDPSISRNHCLVYVKHNSVEIEDLQSTNGLQVRGERATRRTEINVGDEVMIGNVKLHLREVETPADATQTFIGHRNEEND